KVDAVPYNIYNIGNKELLMDMVEKFSTNASKENYDSIIDKIASMSCKSAIKANHKLSEMEVKSLLKDLFALDNPYNCPHGRPTIISLSKNEFEKRFGRIV
ncbi:MAG: DNA mismatch repair protein MutL, partial [Lachnospiraceae bacterium]|nr:DNA mismatch repair protein MutL [Lachnospiraceae bacterium]